MADAEIVMARTSRDPRIERISQERRTGPYLQKEGGKMESRPLRPYAGQAAANLTEDGASEGPAA